MVRAGARAQLVEEGALVAAGRSGKIIAALDVYYREPLPPSHPLAVTSNVVLTPHLGYSVIEVYREYYQHCIENALAYLDGKPIRVPHGVSNRGDGSNVQRERFTGVHPC